MLENFDLEEYLSSGVENIVKGALRATLQDPKESIFMAKYAISSKEATKKRRIAKKQGKNIPPFLIASITSNCNLHCAGCYARSNHACSDEKAFSQLTKEEWAKIFHEATRSWHRLYSFSGRGANDSKRCHRSSRRNTRDYLSDFYQWNND